MTSIKDFISTAYVQDHMRAKLAFKLCIDAGMRRAKKIGHEFHIDLKLSTFNIYTNEVDIVFSVIDNSHLYLQWFEQLIDDIDELTHNTWQPFHQVSFPSGQEEYSDNLAEFFASLGPAGLLKK